MKTFRTLFNHDAYAALKIAEYRWFILARFTLTIGWQMQAVIFGWLIYNYTKDAFSLGLIGLAEAIPAISIALFGGHLADKYNRKKLILFFLVMLFSISILLTLFTINANANFEKYGTLPVYVMIFFTGFARGILAPTIAAFASQLVPKKLYANASAWSSTIWQSGAVTGPAIGGLIYGFYGPYAASAVVCFFIAAAFFAYTRISSKPVSQTGPAVPLLESLSSGVKFVFGNQVMLSAITLDLFAVLFGGAVALLPMFADQVLGTGAQGLGFLRAAPALGAVIMALALAFRPPVVNAGNKLLLAVAGFGICMILFALSKNFYLSFALLALSGMLDSVSVVIRSTIMQTLTPDAMRGRVSAVNTIFIGSSNEIGAFESGLAARLLGLVPSVIFGGTMTLLVVLSAYKFAPSLRKLNLATAGKT
ncbi:MAG: MFS transporter [Bacteroidetes bacterium]|nr:MFS transporter [Bacteroidota bacterium]